MSKEMIVFVLLPLFLAGGSWLARAVRLKAKRRQNRRSFEQGVADYLRRYES